MEKTIEIPEGYEARIEGNKVILELKESEDEKIMKALISILKSDFEKDTTIFGITVEAIIAWLEKQGEQNTNIHLPSFDEAQGTPTIEKGSQNLANSAKTCKAEPKFKVGDYIKHNKGDLICKIISVNSGSYYVENIETNGRIEFFNAEQNFHLWTIQDAKDGDVLAEHETIVLFKTIEGLNIKCYCTYHYLGYNPTFYIDTLQNKTPYRPATKEQCDLLFQKMKEAGYEWDTEKKGLRKINQSPAWSEEDEKVLEMITSDYIAASKSFCGHQGKLDFLKSLKERYTWKPSEEQLETLQYLCETSSHPNEKVMPTLESLYNDLKKLKG